MIYLDHNATTPLAESAKKAMIDAMGLVGNPSSVHTFGRMARKVFEDARERIADDLKTSPRNVTFTSGATEANNLMIQGFKGRVLVDATSHDSLLKAIDAPELMDVDANGLIDLAAFERKLTGGKTSANEPTLVAVTAVNNETGVIQPLEAVLEICDRHGAFLYVDAAQAIGKISLNYALLPSFGLSGHKFGGPKGIGALVINRSIDLKPRMRGGGQERSLRAGTENSLGAVGMAAALAEAPFDDASLKNLRDEMEKTLMEISGDLAFFGKEAPRAANASAFALPGVKSEIQLMRFDTDKIAISSGSACSSGKVRASHVLKAMGVPDELAKCAVRVSMGRNTGKREITAFLEKWRELYG